jgi:putative lipase involved disintegration of autophagic bodies
VLQRRVDLTEKLTESEKLMKEMSQTWEEKLQKTGEWRNMSEKCFREQDKLFDMSEEGFRKHASCLM